MEALFVALSLFLSLCGCKSIPQAHVEPTPPLALTTSEAERARREGMTLWEQQPHNLARATEAAHRLEQAARTLRDNYDAQWEAAQAYSFVSENAPDINTRRATAKTGIAFAQRAQTLRADGVEGHYWYAINVGLLADVERSHGLAAVGEMETALKRAMEIDERYDYAGPLRVLGILYLRTPPPPISIGSARKGLRMLQRAVELVPDYPENYLYLAESLRDNHRRDEARDALQKVLDASPWPDRQFESSQWKADAEKLLQKL